MEILDDTEKKLNTDSGQSVESVEPTKTESDSSKQDTPDNKKEAKLADASVGKFNFFPIEILDFRKTSVRNKELHRFRDILNSPFINVPLLISERQEDILPVLSRKDKVNVPTAIEGKNSGHCKDPAFKKAPGSGSFIRFFFQKMTVSTVSEHKERIKVSHCII